MGGKLLRPAVLAPPASPEFEDTSGEAMVAARLVVIKLSKNFSGLPTMI
jgi:hypothetical protein